MAVEAYCAAPEGPPIAWCTGTLRAMLQDGSVVASFALSAHSPTRCSAITGFHAKVGPRPKPDVYHFLDLIPAVTSRQAANSAYQPPAVQRSGCMSRRCCASRHSQQRRQQRRRKRCTPSRGRRSTPCCAACGKRAAAADGQQWCSGWRALARRTPRPSQRGTPSGRRDVYASAATVTCRQQGRPCAA